MLNIGPILLRNILGPVLNTTLDQFLTQPFVYLVFLFFVEAPFLVLSAKHAKFTETQQRKKTLFVSKFVLTVSSKISVFFCIFHFWLLCNCHLRDVFDWWPRNTKYQNNKNKKQQQQQENKMQNKIKSNIMMSKQNKTTSRNTITETKEHMKQKTNTTKTKSKNQKQK